MTDVSGSLWHRAEFEAEYQQVLQQAADIRHYWDVRIQERWRTRLRAAHARPKRLGQSSKRGRPNSNRRANHFGRP